MGSVIIIIKGDVHCTYCKKLIKKISGIDRKYDAADTVDQLFPMVTGRKRDNHTDQPRQ